MIFFTPSLQTRSSISSPAPSVYGSEDEIVKWWFANGTGRLSTTDAVPVYVFDAGNVNPYDGPDIRGATVLLGSQLLTGDIECHLRERGWSEHGHHRDHRYKNVILHLIAKCGNEREKTVAGLSVPAVVAQLPLRAPVSLPLCQLGEIEAENVITDRLKSLAYGRWVSKVSDMGTAQRQAGSPQAAFYRASFRALGLKGNESQFADLAQRTSLQQLRRCGSVAEIETVLQVQAGLCNDGKLSQAYAESGAAVAPEAWHRKSIRPAARPEVRLAFGAVIVSHLLTGWRPWCDGSALSVKDLVHRFGDSLPGKGWCGEWLGNVILPFRSAWVQQRQSYATSLFEKWFSINLNYSYAQLWRHFASLLPRKVLTNFGAQQGLLVLRERYCHPDLCEFCPLKS